MNTADKIIKRNGNIVHLNRDGRRFAFIGNYTVREVSFREFHVTLDADGDDILIGVFPTWDAAVEETSI